MSEEFWRDQVNQMIDQNKSLTRERDELAARVKVLEQSEIVGREVLLPVKREQSLRLMQHAEARGYRKGVEDAAMVAASNFTNVAQFETTYNTLDKIRAAILALLEQTEPGEKK